jgi:hypothetical protein
MIHLIMPPSTSLTTVLPTSNTQQLSVAISIFALLISTIAIFIARGQYVTARHNLRLSLFDRRWKIYIAAHALLNEAAIGFCEMAVRDPFKPALDDVQPSQFLLPETAATVIDEVKKIVAIADEQMRQCRIDRTEDPQAITKFRRVRANLRSEIERLRVKVDGQFAQIMDFRKVT